MSIVAILLSSLGAVSGLQWIGQRYNRWFRDRSFTKLYSLESSRRIILVIPTGGRCANRSDPPTDHPSNAQNSAPNVVTTVEDSMAKAHVLTALLQHGIQRDVVLHSALSEADRCEHLFLICGPAGNEVSRDLLERQDLPLPYTFHHSRRVWTIRDAEKRIVHPETDSVGVDFAIVAKWSNPWSRPGDPTQIFFAAGIEGLGTWGAAYLLSEGFDRIVRYLEGPCRTSGESNFVAVISATRHASRPPAIEITHLVAV